MSFTYTLATDIGRMRLLIPDNKEFVESLDGGTADTTFVFEDEELAVFFELEDNLIRNAVALALETMASNEVYVLKYITLMDLTTNGPAVSKELRARATDLRAQQTQAESKEDGGAFDIAEMVDTSFQARERYRKQWLRGAL